MERKKQSQPFAYEEYRKDIASIFHGRLRDCIYASSDQFLTRSRRKLQSSQPTCITIELREGHEVIEFEDDSSMLVISR
jgi:hypothetical protein